MMRRITVLMTLALALWLAGTWLLSPGAGSAASDAAGRATATAGLGDRTPATAGVNSVAAGFRSRAKLEEHYAKHGREFGRLTIEGYLAMAQRLRDASPGGDVLEIVRPTDGVISRYDRATGAFLAADADGTIRTFFRPNDGEAYFRRQARRSPRP